MLSMPDDSAFRAKASCAAGPAFSSFRFWPFRAPAQRAHVSSSATSLSLMHDNSVGPTSSSSASVGHRLLNPLQSSLQSRQGMKSRGTVRWAEEWLGLQHLCQPLQWSC